MKAPLSLNWASEPVTPVTQPLIKLEQFYFQILSYFYFGFYFSVEWISQSWQEFIAYFHEHETSFLI